MKYVLEIDCPGDSFQTEPGKSAPRIAGEIIGLLADGGGMDGKWEKSDDGNTIFAFVYDGNGDVAGNVRWIRSMPR